jgi:hypothetical protein
MLNTIYIISSAVKSILDKVVTIQKLSEEDKSHIMYSPDGLIQHAKTRMAINNKSLQIADWRLCILGYFI